ncbi:PepSY domain-containing protein [Celeribacter neptunius]|uniref:NADPH--hemoprotein reductase n=1 Tax=Celeribacter neptunius TaxID=588602 RepID=A0A1I3UC26_9RHOB|nr:PepSY domain-containing protein [Celeribacter neptunius]SFJ80465.1 sulfite reductase (NADPH) flavoprotein alpha-component [Celeribacter neptunius]
MFRALHRWAGLAAALLLIIVSLTGVILSFFPLLSADRTGARLDAGALVAAVQENVQGAQQIRVDDNGVVTVSAFGDTGFQQLRIDPASGDVLGPVQSGGLELWFENLHRNLFLSDTGQMAVLIASVAMVALMLSGFALAARRLGGWRKLFARDRGEGAGGLHLKIARIAGLGLIVSAFTGVWMGLATLGLIPDPSPMAPFPSEISTQTTSPADELAGLTAIPGDTLRSVNLPSQGMSGQAYEVETDAGAGFVDPVTGEMLSWADRSGWSRAMDVIHLLHTGQGASLLGLLLGLMALSVPVLSGSGLLIWLGGRSRQGKRLPNTPAEAADVILLVGSEGGTTWRFAHAFARSLSDVGKTTHLAEMNDFTPAQYKRAQSIVLFAATYGDGDAPESAREFLEALADMETPPAAPLSVLGFGDSTFPAFCAYADTVTRAAEAKGWALLLDTHHVDRQAPRDFAKWGTEFAAASGFALGDVSTALTRRPTRSLTLVSKKLYGETAQAPTAVLRFALPKQTLLGRLMKRDFTAFEAGDLLNVIPEGDDSPRSYSLASGSKDGFVEICVRKAPGGLASGQLCALNPGDTIAAYTTPNAQFHAPEGDAPLVLIGAGAGIGALAGMIRGNTRKRETHLFFGMRSRAGGIPFEIEFEDWADNGQLSDLVLALSRSETPRYVQHALQDEVAKLRDLIRRGAHVMICGGRDMGDGVRAVFEDILAPLGLSVRHLEEEGRYAVDVF